MLEAAALMAMKQFKTIISQKQCSYSDSFVLRSSCLFEKNILNASFEFFYLRLPQHSNNLLKAINVC
jgi:hypothetical protein